jgi:uncharacterized protein YfaS (alpha-2-macroglobulin family)
MTVNISSLPAVQLGPALEKLIGYPYGCVEQTSSRLFALLYAGEILGGDRSEEIDSMVQAGIARLWAMQTHSGGLSYWPGGKKASKWGTAYASWCLLEAKNAGYEVDPRFSKELMAYLEYQLRLSENDNDDIYTNALFCRVLSTFGQPPMGWLHRLAEMKDELDGAALAHLAGAFYAAGKKDKAFSLLSEQLPNTIVETTTKGRLTSQVHQEGLMLSTLLDVEPNHPTVLPLVGRLMKARCNGRWGSTLEDAAAIVALARYETVTSKEKAEFKGVIHPIGTQDISFDHTEVISHKFDNNVEQIEISSSGCGKIYISVMTEGLAVDDLIKPYDHQMSVRRRWLDPEGKDVNLNELYVGDLVHVEIELNALQMKQINNLAVVDALPGGMEVENPRLVTSAKSNRRKGYEPEHIEFLDDRVVFFCDIGSERRKFRYPLRIITAGRFALPPIQASCMYDPQVASLGESGSIVIQNK